jgi:hypothetical protein
LYRSATACTRVPPTVSPSAVSAVAMASSAVTPLCEAESAVIASSSQASASPGAPASRRALPTRSAQSCSARPGRRCPFPQCGPHGHRLVDARGMLTVVSRRGAASHTAGAANRRYRHRVLRPPPPASSRPGRAGDSAPRASSASTKRPTGRLGATVRMPSIARRSAVVSPARSAARATSSSPSAASSCRDGILASHAGERPRCVGELAHPQSRGAEFSQHPSVRLPLHRRAVGRERLVPPPLGNLAVGPTFETGGPTARQRNGECEQRHPLHARVRSTIDRYASIRALAGRVARHSRQTRCASAVSPPR